MSSRLVLEKIASEETLCKGATPDDIVFVEQFRNIGRRCEVLAWRAIVRRELGAGVVISYDEFGAPVTKNPEQYISVSHSKDSVAVLLSDTPCAIDIEQSNRNFRGVAKHYLSSQEQAIAEAHNLFAEMWCAKEALYKFYRKGGIDFARDIVISEYRAAENILLATIVDSEPIRVDISHENDLVIALVGANE